MMNLKKLAAHSLFALFGTALAFSASANLVENGSFEEPTNGSAVGGFGNPSTWQIYSDGQVNGWSGSNIEIWQDNFLGVKAQEGRQFIELNSHPGTGSAFSIYQDLATEVGQEYSLTFYYRARSNKNGRQEAFDVTIDGIINTINDHIVGEWFKYTYNFTAQSQGTTLTFTSVYPKTGTVGNFIDNVRVATVPEPGSLVLLGLGLLGLGLARRKQAA